MSDQQRPRRTRKRPRSAKWLEKFEAIWELEQQEDRAKLMSLACALVTGPHELLVPKLIVANEVGASAVLEIVVAPDEPVFQVRLTFEQLHDLIESLSELIEERAESLGLNGTCSES